MIKSELAKEITIAAINNNLINGNTSSIESYTDYHEKVAENVAAFYNKLMEKLNVTEE